MAKYWSQQVRPRSPEVALITLDATTKLPVGKKADQLREDGAALIHEPLSALLAFKSRQARNHFNLLPSYYLRPAPCNLTGQQWFFSITPSSSYVFADPYLGVIPFSELPLQSRDWGLKKLQAALAGVLRLPNRGDQIRAMQLLQGL